MTSTPDRDSPDRNCGVLWTADGFASRGAGRSARQCSRTGCSDVAEVTLTYEYQNSQVWLDTLSDERDPNGYDLCAGHADALTVPVGWQLGDRRSRHAPSQLLAG